MHLHDMRLEGAAFAGGGQKVVRCGRQLIALSSQKCRSDTMCTFLVKQLFGNISTSSDNDAVPLGHSSQLRRQAVPL